MMKSYPDRFLTKRLNAETYFNIIILFIYIISLQCYQHKGDRTKEPKQQHFPVVAERQRDSNYDDDFDHAFQLVHSPLVPVVLLGFFELDLVVPKIFLQFLVTLDAVAHVPDDSDPGVNGFVQYVLSACNSLNYFFAHSACVASSDDTPCFVAVVSKFQALQQIQVFHELTEVLRSKAVSSIGGIQAVDSRNGLFRDLLYKL
ncbi:Hypothetical_protein [Hexamita inflata]|uniref:Hypothetical_protein n=1 Tax=Hexamita inflata TaxID=28002 RepID=A0ABP1HTV0_9EUKA